VGFPAPKTSLKQEEKQEYKTLSKNKLTASQCVATLILICSHDFFEPHKDNFQNLNGYTKGNLNEPLNLN
jgi:hypothetical protein